ncbi:UNVERIFIED_CONTAM: Beta-amyrin 28-monooxygenase [Sesamum radiatum]|uniref:Beta-amyrin 28-monooxygenase n=1 Tax=Sesamum radiatum TaxID=300843 RepID=A0AAW2SGU9_SESRA
MDAFLLPGRKHGVGPVRPAEIRQGKDGKILTGCVPNLLVGRENGSILRLFLNVVDVGDIKRLSDPFTLATQGMFCVPIDLPGMAYNRAIRGGKMVRKELIRIIHERRKELLEKKETRHHDFLSKMLLVTDENGQFCSEMEISNNIIGLLVASFDTTSSAVTSVVNYIAQLPHIYEEVLKEQMEIAKSKGPDELLTWEDIEKMKYSWNVARESFRLTPPAQGAFRETTTEFTYAGFTIPKGWKTFWTVHSSHKNPEYFPEPEKFDPSRFDGNGPPSYTFVPFGGGPRMCPGKEYAKLEVLVFMHNVVRRFKLEKAIPNQKVDDRLTVRLQPHGKP